jgi:pyrophosphatase PpaX
MRRYRTLLFDLDGTLIDSVGLIVDSYHHTLAVHGFPPQPEEYWREGIGTPLRVQLAPFATRAVTLDMLITTYRAYNLTHHDDRVRPFPGITEAILGLRALGCRLGLVTSKSRQGSLRGLGVARIAEAFELIVSADDVTHPKPHPEPVLRALEGLGAAPSESVYVGDTLHDLESGRAAGVATAAVTWGAFPRRGLEPARPDHWIETAADLLALADGTGARGRAARRTEPPTTRR